MTKLLAMVDAGKVRVVIVAKLDRLTRSVKDLCELLERFERRGVALGSVAESFDTGSAAGRLVLNIMAAVSQWEREAIGERNMYRIIQSPKIVALLYEGGGYRQFFMDGRVLPKDPNPTWYGYSVARWDGDTLVVDTAGFNDLSWLDASGHPHSEDLHVTEKFRRVDFGHRQLQITFSDPKTLIRPLNLSITLTYAADTDCKVVGAASESLQIHAPFGSEPRAKGPRALHVCS
jgi:hypothetical protein